MDGEVEVEGEVCDADEHGSREGGEGEVKMVGGGSIRGCSMLV